MRKIKNVITLLLVVFLLMSCSKNVYSHADFMSKFKSKDQVVSQFGIPNQQSEKEGYTNYTYNFGDAIPGINYRSTNTNAPVITSNGKLYTNADFTNGIVRHKKFSRHATFMFDSQDRVVGWNTQGVDFAKTRLAVVKTIVFSGLLVGVGFGAFLLNVVSK